MLWWVLWRNTMGPEGGENGEEEETGVCCATWHYLLCGRRLLGTLGEERRERLVFVFLRGWALRVAEKIQPVGRQTREERKVKGQVEIWKKAKADWQANMQRDEADSQPTLLAVSGVCGLIQANSRTVSEDGRLFLAAFHTDRTQKQWAGEKSYLQANQRISVYKAFLQQPNRKMWGRENMQTEWKIEFPFSLCYLLILFALWPFLHPVLTSC